MKPNEPIDWPARKARALAWMETWRQERDEAQKKRRPMKYVPYSYSDPTAPTPRGAHENI